MTLAKKIFYFYPHASTFILRDFEILGKSHSLTTYEFSVKKKWLLPYEFLKQFLFLIFNLRKADIIICHFAGYSSFLPVLFGKIFKKPALVIVAGNDGSKFSSFKYGNYNKKIFGFFTGKSLQYATHILPVHETLVYQDYNYYDGGKPAQGYGYFYPKASNTPYTPVYYGYDANFFVLTENEKIKDSFITIGNLNDKYAFKRKGFDLVIELAKERPDLYFTLVGWDGIKSINAPKNVKIFPFMGLNDIVKVLNQHEFYLQLSIMEGFPNALAEAMLCGCIPIGSNVSGIPYIIGETGYILQKRNIELLKSLIEKVLKNKNRKEFGQLARNRIANNFTYEKRLENLNAIIKKYT